MPDYRLSRRAAGDIAGIAAFGVERFGIEQARRYRDGLIRRLAAIAESSLRCPAADHVRPGCRLSIYGSHATYCRLTEEGESNGLVGELPALRRVTRSPAPFRPLSHVEHATEDEKRCIMIRGFKGSNGKLVFLRALFVASASAIFFAFLPWIPCVLDGIKGMTYLRYKTCSVDLSLWGAIVVFAISFCFVLLEGIMLSSARKK